MPPNRSYRAARPPAITRRRLLIAAGLAVALLLTLPRCPHSDTHTHRPTPAPVSRSASVDIDQLLPLPKRDYATAADVARRFLTAYATFRFDEPPATYLHRLDPLTTRQLADTISASASDPGLLATRARSRTIATATTTLRSIRDLNGSPIGASIIFIADTRQHITRNGTSSDPTQHYAITVIRAGDQWRVSGLELASTGDTGQDTGDDTHGEAGEAAE